jgi:hypothetical protein
MLTEKHLRDIVAVYYECDKNKTKAAKMLGIPRKTYSYQLKKAFDEGVQLSDGVRKVLDDGQLSAREAKGGWIHNYDEDGKKTAATRWSAPELDIDGWFEKLEERFASLKPVKKIKAPKVNDDDLITLYPIADPHIGMKACEEMTGEKYDTATAISRLQKWICALVDKSPSSGTAIILGVGDLLHADDTNNETPRGKNKLDVDTDIYDSTDLTIEALATAIDAAARKHNNILVNILPGNHDKHSHRVVAIGLRERYRENPRIDVNTSKNEFFKYKFGNVGIAAHHGDKAQPKEIILMLYDLFSNFFAGVKTRILYTAHRHHERQAEIGGWLWVQLKAMTNRDAYAATHAYTGVPGMEAVTYHRKGNKYCSFPVDSFDD